MSTNHQKGSVLLYSMLSMAIMLAIGLSLSSLFVSRLRAALQTRDSVIALYAADSATELCLYEARQGQLEPSPRMPLPTGEAFGIVSTTAGQPDVTGDCTKLGTASFGFRATGTFHGVRRTLEVSQ